MSREASAGRSIDTYPLRLDVKHLAEILGVSENAVYKLDAKGALLRFQNLNERNQPKARESGGAV